EAKVEPAEDDGARAQPADHQPERTDRYLARLRLQDARAGGIADVDAGDAQGRAIARIVDGRARDADIPAPAEALRERRFDALRQSIDLDRRPGDSPGKTSDQEQDERHENQEHTAGSTATPGGRMMRLPFAAAGLNTSPGEQLGHSGPFPLGRFIISH